MITHKAIYIEDENFILIEGFLFLQYLNDNYKKE